MKDFLWGKPSIKTIVLALSPIFISFTSGFAITFSSIGWWIITFVLVVLYALYLWGNCVYEKAQKDTETRIEELKKELQISKDSKTAITKLCREDCTLIKSFADSLHNKVKEKIGHAEITDWDSVGSHCDTICKIVFDFIRNIALQGDEFSVSVFFKRTVNDENEYNMLSRTSYDKHNPASYKVFRPEKEVEHYYFKKLFDQAKTRPAILPTKEAIKIAFHNCDGVDYSQYVGIPVACLGNKMIAILQIVSYGDSLIAKNEKTIEKIVNDYLCTYANLILLADKTENTVHYL